MKTKKIITALAISVVCCIPHTQTALWEKSDSKIHVINKIADQRIIVVQDGLKTVPALRQTSVEQTKRSSSSEESFEIALLGLPKRVYVYIKKEKGKYSWDIELGTKDKVNFTNEPLLKEYPAEVCWKSNKECKGTYLISINEKKSFWQKNSIEIVVEYQE